MAGLSRREMCTEQSGLHPDTYKGWETARFGGLTERGASKVVSHLQSKNYSVSVDWLLYGVGTAPFERLSTVKTAKSVLDDQDKQIMQELMLFKTQPNALDYVVPDEAMSPWFQTGDLVAGIKVTDFAAIVGQVCIVQLESGDIKLRKVLACDDPNEFVLTTTHEASPFTTNVQLLAAAPVVWWRRKCRAL